MSRKCMNSVEPDNTRWYLIGISSEGGMAGGGEEIKGGPPAGIECYQRQGMWPSLTPSLTTYSLTNIHPHLVVLPQFHKLLYIPTALVVLSSVPQHHQLIQEMELKIATESRTSAEVHPLSRMDTTACFIFLFVYMYITPLRTFWERKLLIKLYSSYAELGACTHVCVG